MRVFSIVIGTGRTLFKRRLLGLTFELKTLPYGGMTLLAPKTSEYFRVRESLSVLAGPTTNLLLVVITFFFIRYFGIPFNLTGGVQPAWDSIIANGLIIISCAIPCEAPSLAGEIPNDALLLLKVLFSRDQASKALMVFYLFEGLEIWGAKGVEEGKAWFDRAETLFPENPVFPLMAANVSILAKDYQQARDKVAPLLVNQEIEPQSRFAALNTVAYADCMSRNQSLLGEADECSMEAMRNIPWDSKTKAIRGAVLVELGRINEGVAMLRNAMDEHEDNANKAIAACHLAIAEERRGNVPEARASWAMARQFDPKCVLLG
jgi:tetratricopeptide (TPR) repeat protein